MSFSAPSNDEIRELLIKTPYFEWPTFDHMPLNCFDLTSAVLTFPGDISKSRIDKNSGCADYKVDIDDLMTCPKMDERFDIELWNEKSVNAPWFFGLVQWACLIDVGEYVLRQGFFSTALAVARVQNIDSVNDLTDIEQLKHALFKSLTPEIENNEFKSIPEGSLFTKTINGRMWAIARSWNQLNYPSYKAISAIDHRTIILISATLDNCWFWGEIIPEEVEQKHLASFWDFLGHVHLSYAREQDLTVGTIIRESPGQAEKIDDLPEW